MGEAKELVEMAEKVLKLNMETEETGLKLSITEGGNEGKIKANTSCTVSGEEVPGMQQERIRKQV